MKLGLVECTEIASLPSMKVPWCGPSLALLLDPGIAWNLIDAQVAPCLSPHGGSSADLVQQGSRGTSCRSRTRG